MPNDYQKHKAVIIGGSLGGLFAGVLLQQIGWEVDIFERSPADLDSRGGGIVLQPEVVEVLRRIGARETLRSPGVQSAHRVVFLPNGVIENKHLAPQMQTSWSLIYTTLKEAFGDAHYHRGKKLIGIDQDTDDHTVTASFEDGVTVHANLLIGADGGGSTVRTLLWPGVVPIYAGYVAWRGLLEEDAMPPLARQDLHGDFAFANNKGSHILGYLVPGPDHNVQPGQRIYNWVWYWAADRKTLSEIATDKDGRDRGYSIPEGQLSDRWRTKVYAEAERLLPPGFRAAVQATEEPFVQAIRDLTVERMVKGRVILLGDAAFIPRPHTAASTSKAAANALELVDQLSGPNATIDQALEAWEPSQLRLGQALSVQGTRTGDWLLFKRKPQSKIG